MLEKFILKPLTRLESLLTPLTAFLMMAVILYPKFPFITIPGIYVAIRLEDFLILIVGMVWLGASIKNLKSIFSDELSLSIVLFLITALISVFVGIFLTHTVVMHIGILHFLRRVEYFLAFFIGISAIKNKSDVNFMVNIILIIIAGLFVVGLGQKYFNWPVITTQNLEYAKGIALRYTPTGHLVTTFAGHYDLASFLIMVLPFLVGIIASLKNKSQQLIVFIVYLMGLWLMVQSASRISLVSYFGSTVLLLLVLKKYKWIVGIMIVTIVMSLTSATLLSRYMNVFDVVVEKISKVIVHEVYAAGGVLGALEDRSTSIRLNVEWPRAIRAFRKNPFLGTGYSSITLATDNQFLRILGEIGILGFVTFVSIYIVMVIKFVKIIKLKEFDLGQLFVVSFLCSLSGIFLNAMFIDLFDASKFAITFWLFAGFSFSIYRNYEKN